MSWETTNQRVALPAAWFVLSWSDKHGCFHHLFTSRLGLFGAKFSDSRYPEKLEGYQFSPLDTFEVIQGMDMLVRSSFQLPQCAQPGRQLVAGRTKTNV